MRKEYNPLNYWGKKALELQEENNKLHMKLIKLELENKIIKKE